MMFTRISALHASYTVPITRIPKAIRFGFGLLIVGAMSVPAQSGVLTWTGASSNLIYNSGAATGNWNPTVPTGFTTNNEDWQFPDSATLGAGATNPSFDSGGIFTVGGSSGGGLTFQTGAPTYTFRRPILPTPSILLAPPIRRRRRTVELLRITAPTSRFLTWM